MYAVSRRNPEVKEVNDAPTISGGGHSGGNHRDTMYIIESGDQREHTSIKINESPALKHHAPIIRDLNTGDTFGTLRSGGNGGVPSQKVVIPVLTPDRAKKRQNGRRFKEDGEASFTLTGQDIHGVSVDSSIRRLTPLECERLMGWADNWTRYGLDEKGKQIEISDTQRYKLCGNGVVSNVVRALVRVMFPS